MHDSKKSCISVRFRAFLRWRGRQCGDVVTGLHDWPAIVDSLVNGGPDQVGRLVNCRLRTLIVSMMLMLPLPSTSLKME